MKTSRTSQSPSIPEAKCNTLIRETQFKSDIIRQLLNRVIFKLYHFSTTYPIFRPSDPFVLIDCRNLPSLLLAELFQHIPLVLDAGTRPVKVVVLGQPAIDSRPEAPGKKCVHPCIFKSVHHNRLPAQSRRNTVTLNLVFIISHFLCFSKIFFIYFSAVLLCDKAHENVRSVQLAVK